MVGGVRCLEEWQIHHHGTATSPGICTVPAGGKVTVMTVQEHINRVRGVVGSHGGASVRSSIGRGCFVGVNTCVVCQVYVKSFYYAVSANA